MLQILSSEFIHTGIHGYFSSLIPCNIALHFYILVPMKNTAMNICVEVFHVSRLASWAIDSSWTSDEYPGCLRKHLHAVPSDHVSRSWFLQGDFISRKQFCCIQNSNQTVMLGLHCLGCEYNGLEIFVPLFAVTHKFGVPCACMCVLILPELFRMCDNIDMVMFSALT